jgi:hypothetical protein
LKKQKIKIPQGIEVFSPEENKKIKGEQVVPLTTYWIRRIRQGDVQAVNETISTNKKEV